MNESKCHLTVVYVVLPLVILSFCLGPAVLAIGSSAQEQSINGAAYDAFSTLFTKPVSLMTPASSGNLYGEMDSVRDIFIEYNQRYEGTSRLDIKTATGTSATLSRMQSYISTTERMHLTAHGSYTDADGPRLQLSGGVLKARTVQYWSLQNGLCKLVYLSACNGMGVNGMLNTLLAQRLIDQTSVETVLAFKDAITILAATIISQSFWMFHVTYSFAGGMSAAHSYLNTRDRIQRMMDTILFSGSITISFAIGLIVGMATSGVGAAFVSALLSGVTNWVLLGLALGDIAHGVNNWEIIGNHNLPGLWWDTSGGGGGDPTNPIHLPH